MSESYERVRELSRDLDEYLELARESFFPGEHACLLFESNPPYGEHFHIECALCLRGVCVFLSRNESDEVQVCGAALFDEGLPFICVPGLGDDPVVTWFRD